MNISWNAKEYAKDFSFVPAYGKGLIDLIRAEPGSTCLDLGCGNGTLTAELEAAGFDVTGMDASPEMVELARATRPELRFVLGDATSFELDEPVDVVFSNSMLHWIDAERQPAALAHIAAALCRGGEFVFECGGKGCGARIHEALARAFARHGLSYTMPFFFPTIGEYAPLVEAAGLRVTHALLYDRPTTLVGPDGMTRWIHMFVQRPFEGIEPALADAIVAEAVDELRPDMFYDDRWHADYVRLCMRAEKRG